MGRRVLLDADLDSGLRRSMRGVATVVVVMTVAQLAAAIVTHEPTGRALLVLAIVTPLTLAVGLLVARRASRRR